MKDQLTVVLAALRQAQAKVSFYSEPGNRDYRRAFDEIATVLEGKDVVEAMRELCAADEIPSRASRNMVEAEEKLHKALPGS
jgi:hypothetical protein